MRSIFISAYALALILPLTVHSTPIPHPKTGAAQPLEINHQPAGDVEQQMPKAEKQSDAPWHLAEFTRPKEDDDDTEKSQNNYYYRRLPGTIVMLGGRVITSEPDFGGRAEILSTFGIVNLSTEATCAGKFAVGKQFGIAKGATLRTITVKDNVHHTEARQDMLFYGLDKAREHCENHVEMKMKGPCVIVFSETYKDSGDRNVTEKLNKIAESGIHVVVRASQNHKYHENIIQISALSRDRQNPRDSTKPDFWIPAYPIQCEIQNPYQVDVRHTFEAAKNMAATFMAAGAVLLYASKHGTGPKETKLNMIDNRRRVKNWGKYEIYIPPDVSGEGSGVEELGSGLENLLRLADAASHAQPLVVNDPAKSQQHTTSTSSAVPSAQSPRDQGQLSPKRLRETDPSEPILRSPKTQKFNPNTIASVLNHEQ